jgi:hypothetical protein
MDRAFRSWVPRLWKTLGSGGLGLLACLLVQCTVKQPQVPSTEFTVSIPVADDLTTIEDVAADRSEFLDITGDGRMALDFSTDEAQRETVGDRLTIGTTETAFSSEIPDFDIQLPAIPGASIPVPLPSTGGRAEEVESLEIEGSETIDTGVDDPLVVSRGLLDVTVTNGLPLGMETFELTLFGGTATFANLPAGESATESITLNNTTIGDQIEIGFELETITETVAISGPGTIEIDLQFVELFVLIPPQDFGIPESAIEIPTDQIAVQSATFSKGRLDFDITNNTNLGIGKLDLTMRELRRANGESVRFGIDQPLSASATATASTGDLTNAEFQPDNPSALLMSFAGATDTREVGVPFVSRNNTIDVVARTDSFIFGQVTGTINRIRMPIDSLATSVDFPDGLDEVAIDRVTAQVFLQSAVNLQSSINIRIRGTNKGGNTEVVDIDAVFESGTPEEPNHETIEIDPAQLRTFLNNLPTDIVVFPEVFIGSGDPGESIAADHWVQIDSVVFNAPARFEIQNDTQIRPDPELQNLEDEEARQRISDNLVSASVFTNIENHLPIGIRVRLMVSPNREEVYTNPVLTIPAIGQEPFKVPAAPVDENGRVTRSQFEPAQGEPARDVTLTKDDVLVFLQPGGVWTGVLVELDATGGTVELFATDFVKVQAAGRVIMELNEDLVK